MIATRRALRSILVTGVAFAAACGGSKPMTYGDANSLVAVASPELWDQVADQVYAALEQTIVTVRDEKKFTVTYQEPFGQNWENLRRFRQLLVIGSMEDPWVQEVVEEAPSPITEPGVHQIPTVYSREQIVTLILLPGPGRTEDLSSALGEVFTLIDDQYRRYAQARMYVSGVDSALADTLMTAAGFSMILPDVYRWHRQDSVFVFRNDNPDPSELIREIVVTWRTPAAAQIEEQTILSWREQIVAGYYSEPQDMVLDEGMSSGPIEHDGHAGWEIQAQWRNPPDRGWPAGGPFLTRAVTCDTQDRTYLIDAWLYAPSQEKYEYMIQLETLLDTFECEG